MNSKKTETFPKMQAQGKNKKSQIFDNNANVKRTTYCALEDADDADAVHFLNITGKCFPGDLQVMRKLQLK